ncbi:hypothetical protein GUJ93_ZPchr0012g19538 [Zizania palustris]|uniref:Uncharacterized protein n=1 Tax=Zizania palustris TaxID=103762 RepID=A0A8J5WQZ6_ZIZPA|nr:hypothetical protein GUJ93_ZPchr0012g19538 [Zizania palustris]
MRKSSICGKFRSVVARWREQVTRAETMREAARREKECVQQILNVKTVVKSMDSARMFNVPDSSSGHGLVNLVGTSWQELSKKALGCVRLQEKRLMIKWGINSGTPADLYYEVRLDCTDDVAKSKFNISSQNGGT